MKFCSNCGCELMENARFCTVCGIKVLTQNTSISQCNSQIYSKNNECFKFSNMLFGKDIKLVLAATNSSVFIKYCLENDPKYIDVRYLVDKIVNTCKNMVGFFDAAHVNSLVSSLVDLMESCYISDFENENNISIYGVPLVMLTGTGISYKKQLNKAIVISTETVYVTEEKCSIKILDIFDITEKDIVFIGGRCPHRLDKFNEKTKLLFIDLFRVLVIVIQYYYYVGTDKKCSKMIHGKNIELGEPLEEIRLYGESGVKEFVRQNNIKI